MHMIHLCYSAYLYSDLQWNNVKKSVEQVTVIINGEEDPQEGDKREEV